MTKLKINAFGNDQEIALTKQQYGNDRLAICAICTDDGSPWGTLTVNVPEIELADDEIIVKNYSENAAWVPQVLEQLPEVFEKTEREANLGYVSCPIYRYKG